MAGGKFGEFGELYAIRQTKLVLKINNLLADLLIRQTFFHQILEISPFAELSPRQTFPLYGNIYSYIRMFIKIVKGQKSRSHWLDTKIYLS